MRLLFVGRMLKYKGAELLINAFRKLKVMRPDVEITLHLVGDGEDEDEIRQAAEGSGAIFVGFQANIASYYEKCDVFVNPTYGPEGSPLVTLEAMSHRVPVLLSDLKVNREISEEGKFAKLFKRGDVDDLVSKLSDFLERPDEMNRYSQLSCWAVEKRFSAGAAFAEYEKIVFS